VTHYPVSLRLTRFLISCTLPLCLWLMVPTIFFFALFSPVLLLYGCVNTTQLTSQTTSPTDSTLAQKPATRTDLSPDLLDFLMMKDEEEREIFASTPLEEEKKQDQNQEKIESSPTAVKPSEEPLTVLQEAPGPKADDQLVDLWQKDFDKAVQQPAERRQIEFSMPVVENDRVRYFVNFFSARTKDFFERALARSGRYIPMMATILRDEGLPEDLVYLSLIESGFSPYAYSRAKAVGPWQFIRGTGLRYGLKINWWIDERRDPVKSTHAAAAYLKDLHLQFGEWFLAAAAYNAGERKVEKAVNRSKTNDFWRLSQKSYLKQETRNYVPKFIAAAIIARDPEKHGFGDVLYESPMEYDEVTITSPLTLKTAADLADTTVDAIKELNPALLRTYTPPSEDGFVLRVPAGSGEAFARAYELLPGSGKVKFLIHRVAKGETLQGIAKRYGQRVNQLMEINSLTTQSIREGRELTVMFDGALPPAPARKK